jgi:cytochrome P450
LSIHKLHFLHAVIQESLRLFPPITNGFPREVGAGQDAIIDGRLVPRGVSVMDKRARPSI